jgi:mRNA-degrading endonuclease RelE of RelBE toxin-antitoxin system
MNKILKFLSKLSPKERKNVEEDLKLIVARKFETLDIRKLSGFDNFFRSKRGKVRIIFLMEGNKTQIIKIGRRNDTTYNF